MLHRLSSDGLKSFHNFSFLLCWRLDERVWLFSGIKLVRYYCHCADSLMSIPVQVFVAKFHNSHQMIEFNSSRHGHNVRLTTLPSPLSKSERSTVCKLPVSGFYQFGKIYPMVMQNVFSRSFKLTGNRTWQVIFQLLPCSFRNWYT